MAMSSFTAGNFGFMIDGGKMAGYVSKVSGGNLETAGIIKQNLGTDPLTRKSVGAPKYSAISVDMGMGMSRAMYDWINLYFKRQFQTKTGVIHACNAKYESMAIRELLNMHIEECSLPALSGDSKDPCKVALKLKAEKVNYKKGDGKVISGEIGEKHKLWLASNFRVEIGGLPCKHVTKVDAVKFTVKLQELWTGEARECQLHPAAVEINDLKLTISMIDYEKWRDYADTSLVKGNQAQSAEMTGSITYLTPDGKENGRLDLAGMDIHKITVGDAEANKEGMWTFDAELTLNSCHFVYSQADS